MEITAELLDKVDDPEELQEMILILEEQERRRGLDDLYYFCKYILHYRDMQPRTHKPVCRFVEDKTKKKKHMEFARGTFKSSVITIGSSIQDIAKDPNIRILIDNEVYGNSKAFLREIKSHLDSDELQALYPQLAPNKQINEGFTEASVIVKGRDKHTKEPTISCAGLDQIKVGMHYDKIIMDDLVSDKNVTSKEQMQKVINHYKLALSLLEPEGELIIVGTRYHYSDLYGYLLDNESDVFYHMIVPARLTKEAAAVMNEYGKEFGYAYQEGELFFPERLTESYLQEQRASQGGYIYNCQYMLDPVDQEDNDFPKDWFQYYRGKLRRTKEEKWELVVEWVGDDEKQPIEDVKVPFTVPVYNLTSFDPANKKKKKSDYTGGVTVAITPDGDWFVLNIIMNKYNPREIVDRIIDERDKYLPLITGIEEEGKESIKFYLVERMRKLNNFFRIKELKSGGVKKEDRIRRLIPRFENRTIYFPTSIKRKVYNMPKVVDLVEYLEDEFIYFPKARSDNIIDALAYIEEMIPKRKKDGQSVRRKGRAKYIR